LKRASIALTALALTAPALVVPALSGCDQQLDLSEPHHEDAVQFSASGDALLEQMTSEDGWLVSPTLEARDDFERVVVMFDAKTPVAVEIRTSADAETFGPWQALALVFSEEEAHTGSTDTDGGLLLQMRVQAPVEAGLSFVNLSAFLRADDDDATALASGSQTAGLLRDSEDVVSVSQWGGQAPRCGLASHTPNRITIHHTETGNNPNVSPAVRLRQIQSYHFSRGWCDVGYHLLIGNDGRIYQGRPENKRGAHAGSGNNTGNVGISFVGSFMTELPNAAMLEAGARAIAGVAEEWNIPIDRDHVFGHRQMRSTSCPGDALYAHLETLVDMARDGSSAPPSQPEDPPSIQQPDRIDSFPAVISGDTSDSARDSFDSYSCSPSTNESGPEDVYEIVISEAGFLRVEVDDGGTVDIDLHLLGSLDASSCLDRDDEFIRFAVTPGTYWLVADSYQSDLWGARDGPYTMRIDLEVTTPPPPPSTGVCTVVETQLEMVWSSCAHDDCTSVNGRRFLSLPTTGPVVKEAHLVTLDEDFPSGWPAASRDGIARHYQMSEDTTDYLMNRTESWAPAGEGGSLYGQGATSAPLPIEDEAWYITMYWKSRPPAGTRMVVRNPLSGRAVIASAGWETGPGANTAVAGVSEEIHHFLGTSHLDDLTIGFAANDNLPLGPISCDDDNTGNTDPVPPPVSAGSYSDVPSNHPAFEAAEALRGLNAMWGCSPGVFCPGNTLVRDQLALLIATLETGDYDVPSSTLYGDVSSSHWAYSKVQELGARQITVGCGGGQYCPGLYVSRATFAVYLRRALGLSSATPTSFDDVSSSHWAASSIEAAFRAGLVEACSDGSYCPDEPITRADAAVYAARAYGLVN